MSGTVSSVWWPVLVGTVPMADPWSVGDQVSVPLRWRDDPDLPDDLQLRGIPFHADVLTDEDGPWAQLLSAGGVTAVRTGQVRTGAVRLSGCLEYDQLSQWEQIPRTTGTVRRVRVVQNLYDRGPDRWVPVPGVRRLPDVAATAPQFLRDDPPGPEADPDEEPDPATLRFMSMAEYFALARDHLPPQQWQATGFLADLEVPHP